MPYLFVMMLYPFVGMPYPLAATPEPFDARLHPFAEALRLRVTRRGELPSKRPARRHRAFSLREHGGEKGNAL
jgi:hypothetical protein